MRKTITNIHFIGICGTAMGSVAAALQEQGYKVTGSDANVYPPMSTYLEERGIVLSAGFSPGNLPADADLIVVGNAISRGNPELEEMLNRKLYYLSLPETLKEFFLRGRRNLVVTGTHGKTTTTSLLAWIFEFAGRAPGYMIGGIPKNLEDPARLGPSEHFVIEGDEYDTAFFDKRSKFVHYLPELVIVNNIEFDHADIFDDLAAIQLSFRRMLNIVPKNGLVLVNSDDANSLEAASTCPAPTLTVGFAEDSGCRISHPTYGASGSQFDFLGHRFQLGLVGEYNVRNAAMAICAARHYDIPMAKIAEAVAEFQGVRRRQEVCGEVRGVKVIDDFGHHPTAIRQALAGLRQQYAGSRLWAVFEPRSNTTRRAVFQNALPGAFAEADGVYLSQVARLDQLPPEDRLHPEKVVEDLAALHIPAHYLSGAAAIVSHLVPQTRPGDVIVVFSNGGFEGIHGKLLAALRAPNASPVVKSLPESSHRAHHYPTLIRRWRAVAKKWDLTLKKYGEHDGFPLYVARSNRQKASRASFYLSTGVHGDEPGATEGVLLWAERQGEVFSRANFLIFPCLNPWGLTNNVRTDASGTDLNRQFHNENIPALVAWRKMLEGKRFDLALTLHEDYDGQGLYLYELSSTRDLFSPILLQAASRILPTDPRGKIDGRRFPQPGYIHRNVLSRKLPEGPEAITLARAHADHCFTMETPSEFALHRRVEAQRIIIQKAIGIFLKRHAAKVAHAAHSAQG